jgi:hypothetical protein
MLLVLAWITPAWGEPPGSGWTGLEHMMAPEQFRSAGLSKLTPEELSRLNEWLVRFIAHDSQQLIKSDEAIQELQKAPVRRRISGAFTGWTGNTVFALDNGEVWKQRLPGRYAVKLQNPEVEISRNLLGFYELRLVKTGKKIGVSRIR